MDKTRLILFCLFCTTLLLGLRYIGDSIEKAEIYYCYYDVPPLTFEEEFAPIIKALCQNESRNTTYPYCQYQGTRIK